ncbi:UDP-3-O-acyl-N-acetylglucosamine deacetylase [Spirulina subsalsa FACHB-351]|uniref:UDP-3-O-acyl-N-acetylglucosamine deacetylase n=1 Tax=Spirulina subsalsa FACHB-351 TaxID=234711 RepID=A0ABT3L3X2_9CYAN|nr:UDP-3-O-acyl-N-acetylglucosamine deacetylase [Spirulina subsalsa]MCW6036198.1 UDP-3-O-acyl-N-acetylglucosamine deacetylase [Spirulina subsalsa FACHB-351]
MVQRTIREAFSCGGVGLHSGQRIGVRVCPAQRGGRYFVRVDLPEQPVIRATVGAVCQTSLSTELGQGMAKVRTVEHLLAALAGCGVDHARIEIDGGEVPLLDGSAGEWVKAIAQVGLQELPEAETPSPLVVKQPITVQEGEAFVTALPAPRLRLTYGIDFTYSAIGNQWYSWSPEQERFEEAIAPARTFGFADQVEQLRQAGLIKGGTLENALVCDETGWLNPPLRFANEPARHKLLDLVGDLSLLGLFPQAHILAYKASHKLHIQLAQALLAEG